MQMVGETMVEIIYNSWKKETNLRLNQLLSLCSEFGGLESLVEEPRKGVAQTCANCLSQM